MMLTEIKRSESIAHTAEVPDKRHGDILQMKPQRWKAFKARRLCRTGAINDYIL